MKRYLINFRILSLFIMAMTLIMSPTQAQKSKTDYQRELAEKYKAIQENFKLTNPTVSTDISKPFRISGHGVPGATVEINVRPVSTGGGMDGKIFIPKYKKNTYEPQIFKTTVDEKGNWSLSEKVEVSFPKDAKARRVHIIAGQYKGNIKMKKPITVEIKLDNSLISVHTASSISAQKVKDDFRVLTKSGKDITVNSPDMQVATVGTAPFKMQGRGTPNTRLIIDVYYSGTQTEYKKVSKDAGIPISFEKKVTHIKNKKFASFPKPIGEDGKWGLLAINPYEPKIGNAGTELLMSSIVIHYRVFNGTKEIMKKSVTLAVVPNLNAVFFK